MMEPQYAPLPQEPFAEEPPKYLMGFLWALAAAVVGALLWWLIAQVTDYTLGLVAWLVGRAVGWAAQKGAGGKGDTKLQAGAAILGGLGIIFGYYLIIRSAFLTVLAAEGVKTAISESTMVQLVIAMVRENPEVIGPMGVLFIVIGIADAWRSARGSQPRIG